MYDTVTFTLGAALAAAGTVTVSYPSGRSKGNYSRQTGRHILRVAGSAEYTAPDDFTLTFNANSSNITLTWGSGKPTLAAGTKLYLQIERAGEEDGRPVDPANVNKMVLGNIWEVDLGSPNVADADGVAASQSVTIATTPLASINGLLASGGVATFDVPRNVVATWTGTAVLTVTGTDEYGNTLVESSASGTSMTGKKAFKTVTACSFSANVTGATIGSGDVLGLPMFLPAANCVLAEFEDGVQVGTDQSPVRLPFVLEQVSLLAGTTAAAELISPVTGVISRLTTVVRAAVTTGGAVTVKNGTTDVDGLSITVADGATKGTTQTDTPTAGHATTVVAKNNRIQVVPADAFATAGALEGFVEIQPTGNGIVTAGAAAAKQTATTGDVRGTYAPATAPDGSVGYKLLVQLADPAFKGDAQYAG